MNDAPKFGVMFDTLTLTVVKHIEVVNRHNSTQTYWTQIVFSY